MCVLNILVTQVTNSNRIRLKFGLAHKLFFISETSTVSTGLNKQMWAKAVNLLYLAYLRYN